MNVVIVGKTYGNRSIVNIVLLLMVWHKRLALAFSLEVIAIRGCVSFDPN